MVLEYKDLNASNSGKGADAPADNKGDQGQRALSVSAWENMSSLLKSAGSKPDDIIKTLDNKQFVDLTSDDLYGTRQNLVSRGEITNSHAASKDAKSAADKTAIHRDVEPSDWTVKPGDTLSKIAKEKLGNDASNEEIHQYVKEVAKLNGIKNPDLIIDGHQLKLPGHTKDGGLVTVDKDGNKTTEWKDGRYRVDSTDGTGFEVKPDQTGGYTEKHWGQNPQDNFEKAATKDGIIVTTYANGDVLTSDTNGFEQRQNKDGTGYVKTVDAAGKTTNETHWGPVQENNYELKPQADGSLQGKDNAGNTHTKWENGAERVDYTDGRGYVKSPDTLGGYSEHHWGPRPGDNFESKVSADGKTEVREKPAEHAHESLNDKEIKTQREKLDRLAEDKIHDPEQLAKFKADMARFEERSSQLEDNYKKQGLSPEDAQKKAHEEIAQTYEQVSRVLEAKDNPAVPIDAKGRTEIAEQVMSQAANPGSIDQGCHPTCNVTTVETRTYSRNPQEAAKLVADMTTTGKYTTPDGTTVTLDQESLKPHDGAKTNPPVDGARSYASQLFQVTTVNIAYAERGDDMHYEQHEPDPTVRNDDGARQVDWSVEPHEIKAHGDIAKMLGAKDSDYHSPDLSDEEIMKAGNKVNGEKDTSWYLADPEHMGGKVTKVESEKELEDQIKAAKEQGKLPIVVKVHTGNEPFLTDSGGGSAGGSGGWHVVTVTDYEAGPPAKVKVDNQWGSNVDHNTPESEVSIHDLYHSMHNPQDKVSLQELEKDVEASPHDHYKQAELLRVKHNAGKLDDDEYKEQLAKAIKETQADWDRQKRDGTFKNDDQFLKTWVKLRDQVNTLPADQRMELTHLEKQTGFFTDDSLTDANIRKCMVDIINEKRDAEAKDKFDSTKKEQYESAVAEFKKIMDELPESRRAAIMEQVKKAQDAKD